MITPALRFREFTDDWQATMLGKIAKLSKGIGVSRDDIDENGATEAIRYGELYTTYGEVVGEVVSHTDLDPKTLVLSHANDVIIPSSGETSIDIATASCVLRDGVALGGDLNIIRTDQNGVWLAYYLNSAKRTAIAKLAQGVSVVHLYSSDLKKLKINLPSLTEQKKIARFLSLVDELAATQARRVELLTRYKTGITAKIFSRAVRFRDSSGADFSDWEVKKLGEVFHYIQPTKYIVSSTEYSDYFITPVLTAGKTFILGCTNETHGIYENPLPCVIFDDFTTASQFVNFPFKVKSSAMKILIARNGVDIRIAFELLKQVRFLAEEHKRHWIGEFRDMTIKLPCFAEQRRIAAFLSALDLKISTESDKVVAIKDFKKSLLQRMFV